MSEKLFRLKSPLISNGLISALRNPDSVSVEEVDCTVDLTTVSYTHLTLPTICSV